MKIAIVTFPGSAGESDILAALLSVGFNEDQVEIVNEQKTDLSQFAGLFIPGGASYAHAVRPGAVAKVTAVAQAIKDFAKSGKPVIGLGNGFQILTELELLPGGFLKNKTLKTVNGFVDVSLKKTDTVFTNFEDEIKSITLPISHLYGQYHVDEETLERLEKNGQIVMNYVTKNPNGSTNAIAGVSNETGNVIGMMPKPERAMDAILGSEAGRPFFESFYNQVTKG
ncbi:MULTISPECIES: phosphoribosylformylglycinamidine synthase subunit PurQ [unclassified Jeotgalibaca]|uniref:phosphoribosylformylglycinamidine synthase subunit PurQ n=1 Tax=unclassified Jeotgalibaca TaxID=2621505 RepID=UPI003FD1D0D6